MKLVKSWKDVSIAKKLYFVVGIMALLIVGELLTLRFAMHTLSAARAFVGGEGLWSKSQKNAAISLQRYGLTRDEADFTAFLTALRVPEGDRRARLELFKAAPDRAIIREAFLQGRIHPDDIDPMIDLLQRFSWTSYLSRAIAIWGAADESLAEFKAAGMAYHAAILAADSAAAASHLAALKQLNESLTNLEDEFSFVLGAGSRWLERLVLTLLSLAVLAVESIGITLTFLTSRSISRGLNELNVTAMRIGRGDFAGAVPVRSRDEIGQLAGSVNQMGQMLQSSYAELEVRVKERTVELAQSRDQLDVILRAISDGITVVDDQGRFVFANETAAQLVGAPSVEALMRLPQARLFEDLEILDEGGAPFPLEKLPSRLAFAGVARPPEVVLRSRRRGSGESQGGQERGQERGEERWSIVKSAPVLDERGRPRLVVTIIKDFTGHKRAEDAVRFLDEASQILASSMTYKHTLQLVAALAVPRLADECAIDLLDDDGGIDRVAHVPARALGVGSGALLSLGVPRNGKLHDDGIISAMVVPLRAREKLFGVLTLVSTAAQRRHGDTDLRVAEELARRIGIAIENAILFELAQKAIQEREDFLSVASHELNTPLTSLRLQLQMARQKVARADTIDGVQASLARALAISETQVTRLTRLVEELLDVSRIKTGSLSFKVERLDLSQTVRAVAGRFSDQLAAVGSSLDVTIEDGIVGAFDQLRVEQVVDNLLSNAMKYAAGKAVRVALARAQGTGATLTVEDDGPGIPEAQHATIFQRFARLATAGSVSGLGLGLFIVKEIVDGQGGVVRVDSRPGEGTRFVVTLPLADPAPEISHGV